MKNFTAASGLLIACAGLLAGQSPPNRAGDVRAVVPLGQILRQGAPPKDAARDDSVFWEDIARTARGGRLRIGLLDGSILNVGSESQLQILKHDAQGQNTALDLAYGRLRARVVRLAAPGAGFRVRTPTAVVGVVGTRFVVRVFADFTEVLCLEGLVRVRNRDDSVPGEVVLRPGEFTRVARGLPPTPPAPTSAAQLQESLEETDIPPGPLDWSRAEISWPPAGCGEIAQLAVRAWFKQLQNGAEVEARVDPELVSGALRLGGQNLSVEAGYTGLAGAPLPEPTDGAFMPTGHTGSIPTKIWPAQKLEEGAGWRAPRAVLGGSAFYVLGPMGPSGNAVFRFGQQAAELLWKGSCGAAFLAPQLSGGEHDVALAIGGQPVARGKINVLQVTYRPPNPPAVVRGQQATFGIDLRGLAGLDRLTQGQPVLVVVLTNQTPQTIGNLRSSTPGAKVSGETITYRVGSQNIDPTGAVRLEGSARGRQAGAFTLGVQMTLEETLERPRTPLSPAPAS